MPAYLRSSWLSWTVAFALCLATALMGIDAWQICNVREASLRGAKIVTASLAESFSQQIETTLKIADTVVATLVQRIEVGGPTGLPHRRCFNETIRREFQRAESSGHPFSLIMSDIDLFKSYNDQYGHPAGDACLRAIGATMQGVLRRPGDIAARYGGEEFAILLPETEIAGAVRIVGELQTAIHKLANRHEAGPLGVVTLSAGVAARSPGRSKVTLARLVGAADAALYKAKAYGRNTFAVCQNLDLAGPTPSPERKKAV